MTFLLLTILPGTAVNHVDTCSALAVTVVSHLKTEVLQPQWNKKPAGEQKGTASLLHTAGLASPCQPTFPHLCGYFLLSNTKNNLRMEASEAGLPWQEMVSIMLKFKVAGLPHSLLVSHSHRQYPHSQARPCWGPHSQGAANREKSGE
jgi:hypothetical protein